MSIISDHRPYVPWRRVRAVVTPTFGAAHHVDLHVADEPADTSIAEWLAGGDSAAATVVEAPACQRPTTGPDDVQGVARMPFTVHRDLDDDERLTESLLAMERESRSLADVLAGENDQRMTLLLAASGAALARSARRARWVEALFEPTEKQVFRRRRERITPLVLELGHLVATGDVDPGTAAAVMGLRSRYLSAVEAESQRLPQMTPELLAELDTQYGRVAS